MATGSMSQIEGEIHGGSSTMGKDGGGSIRTDPAGRRREDRIVGATQATRDLVAQATAAARSDLPVFVIGPSGSDKDLVARAIHVWGRRSESAFEALSCSAIPEVLQAREIFGCTEGVYPALPAAYAGALERASGATLLLEGIDTLRAELLSTVLEAIATKSFHREGETTSRPLGARLIGTADQALPELSSASFPHHMIKIVPLADRPEDLLPLAAHYLRAFAEDEGVEPVGFTADARVCLLSEAWPGDVRELRERIRQAVRLAGKGAVSAEALMLARDAEEVPSFKEAKRAFETRYVVGLLRRCGGNISRAARLAKKDRKDFYDVIRRTGVDPSQFR
jgi:two-component system response regulator GlrR